MLCRAVFLALLLLQWKSACIDAQPVTEQTIAERKIAEQKIAEPNLTEITNKIVQLEEKFENTVQTMKEFKLEENFLLSVLSGQQKELGNKLQNLKNIQDQMKESQDEMKKAQTEMKKYQDDMKQSQIDLKKTQQELDKAQEESKRKANELLEAKIKKQACEQRLLSLKTKNIDGKLYYFSHDRAWLSWDDADKFCKTYGLQLVSVESNRQWEAIKSEVDKLTSGYDYPWSSGIDRVSEGTWKWSANGNPVYFYAGKKYMDNTNSENCLFLSYSGWGDGYCYRARPFICQQYTLC